MFLSIEEKTRYSRQFLGESFSIEAQLTLKASTALVAGIGGLGGTAALYLASAGVGRLIIVHAGELELPDMNRQTLMNSDSVGKMRVDIAKVRLREINPNCEVITRGEWITDKNVDGLVKDADIVLDCRHNFTERLLLNEACVKQKKVMVEGATDDMFGYVTTISPGVTPCLSCIFPEAPTTWEHLGFAVMGAVPGTLGSLMALEALKVLTGTGAPLYSKLLTVGALDMEFRKLKIKKDDNCTVCAK